MSYKLIKSKSKGNDDDIDNTPDAVINTETDDDKGDDNNNDNNDDSKGKEEYIIDYKLSRYIC